MLLSPQVPYLKRPVFDYTETKKDNSLSHVPLGNQTQGFCLPKVPCIFICLTRTHLTCKEVSADLYYNLVVLVRRLVPGHHHFCTGQVLQLVYLQPQERDQNKNNLRVKNRINASFFICWNEVNVSVKWSFAIFWLGFLQRGQWLMSQCPCLPFFHPSRWLVQQQRRELWCEPPASPLPWVQRNSLPSACQRCDTEPAAGQVQVHITHAALTKWDIFSRKRKKKKPIS